MAVKTMLKKIIYMVISAMEKIYINQGNIMGHGKVGLGRT